MSTTAPHPAAGPLDIYVDAQVSMATLARVELRKALDTRAGRWLVDRASSAWSSWSR